MEANRLIVDRTNVDCQTKRASSRAVQFSGRGPASRLNSAPPYKSHAWPPISSERTPFRRIVERTLRIGLGVKRTSQFEVRLPQFRRLLQPLGRGQHVPLRPFVSNERSQVDHARSPPQSVPCMRLHWDCKRYAESMAARRRGARGSSGSAPAPRPLPTRSTSEAVQVTGWSRKSRLCLISSRTHS
jgi:hypothetical protein